MRFAWAVGTNAVSYTDFCTGAVLYRIQDTSDFVRAMESSVSSSNCLNILSGGGSPDFFSYLEIQ